MSLIVTARILTRSCQYQLLSKYYKFTTPKLFGEKNLFKVITATTPIIQKRLFNDDKNNNIDINDDIEHIYHGSLIKKIKFVKIFSFTTSLFTSLTQPFLLPKIIESSNTFSIIFVGGFSLFFAVVTPFLLYLVTRKYILDIYYNKKTKVYTGTTYNFFLKKNEIKFTPSDVEQPELRQMLTTCFVKGQPILIDFHDFYNHDHYAAIMNYDKPINFKFTHTDPIKIENSMPKLKIDEKKSMTN